MKILVINGPNLNMLGIREKSLYGNENYSALVRKIKEYARKKGVRVRFFQSNCEGAIVTRIQKAYRKFDGIVLNAGAYTHTSVAILDALKSVNIPTAEVHITEIAKREEFRKVSYVSLYAQKTICGLGFDGYLRAIDFLCENK